MSRRTAFVVGVALLSPVLLFSWCVIGAAAGAISCAERLAEEWRAM